MEYQIFDGISDIWWNIGYLMAWVRPSMGIRSRPLEKMTYFRQNGDIFHVGAQIGCKSRKTTFYVFGLFTPLFRRFRRSSVSHGSRFDEIYRFVSSILHFMPSGSISENLSKIYRKSIEHLSKIYRTSIGNLSNTYRTSMENLWKIYGTSIENLSKNSKSSQTAWNEELMIPIDASRHVQFQKLRQRAWNAEIRG